MITDFGEAYDPLVTKRFAAHTPAYLSPPESRFFDSEMEEESLSYPSDIWTLACSIWELFGNTPLFQTFADTPDEVTTEQVEILGKLPDRWWAKWTNRHNWFDEDGKKNVKEKYRLWHGNSYETWNRRFPEYILRARRAHKFDIWSIEEEKAFEDMMKMMLVMEPDERATIDQVVQCDWMKGWGFPEFKRIQAGILCLSSYNC